MAIRQINCESLGEYLCAKFEISPQTQENGLSVPKWNDIFVESRLSRDLTDRFSLNFPDSCMAIRQTLCESSDGFLCAKFKISPQTQENGLSVPKWNDI